MFYISISSMLIMKRLWPHHFLSLASFKLIKQNVILLCHQFYYCCVIKFWDTADISCLNVLNILTYLDLYQDTKKTIETRIFFASIELTNEIINYIISWIQLIYFVNIFMLKRSPSIAKSVLISILYLSCLINSNYSNE